MFFDILIFNGKIAFKSENNLNNPPAT